MATVRHNSRPRWSCGEIVFARNGEPVHLMGAPRRAMLRKFYARELPPDVEVWAFTGERWVRNVKHEDCYWATFGREVTGPRR